MNQKKLSLGKNEIALIILIAGIFIGVFLVGQRTFFLPKAYDQFQEEAPIVFERPTPTPEPNLLEQAKRIKVSVDELFSKTFNGLIDKIKSLRSNSVVDL